MLHTHTQYKQSARLLTPQHSIALCVILMNLLSLENVKKCLLGWSTITSKTKINIFFHSSGPFLGLLHSKTFQKKLILAFEAKHQ